MVPAGNKRAQMSLDDLVAQLTKMFTTDVVAIVLYGSSARDEHVAGLSDHNVLVILESLSLVSLQGLGQMARAWQDAGNPPPLMLTRDEWLGSSDVFPMEYADILERHRVLAGALPQDAVQVRLTDLRLQVEQEALGKVLRLRRAVMMAGTDVGRQRELLRASFSAFMVILRAVERLHGGEPSPDAETVVRAVAARSGFDAAPFLSAYRLVHGEPLADADVGPVLAGYVSGAETLVRYLDGFTLPQEL